MAAQIGYNTQILFSFRAALWYAGERLGRNEVEITRRMIMVYCTCPNPACGAELVIYENDTMPGCREMEEVYCPICRTQVHSVFTSGIPSVEVRSTGKKD